MATIVTRSGKGSPLTNTEVDANFTNLNDDKAELSGANFTGSIDVTGTVTADDLIASDGDGGTVSIIRDDATVGIDNSLGNITWYSTEDGGSTINQGASIIALSEQNHSTVASGSRLVLTTTPIGSTTSLNRLLISNNGDISFYEDTGTTPKFFWDASAEALGIGTSTFTGANSFMDDVVIYNTTDASGAGLSIISNPTNGYSSIAFGDTDDWDTGRLQYNHAENSMAFHVNAAERLRIDSSGNVGIGTSSPDTRLEISADTECLKLTSTDTVCRLRFEETGQTLNTSITSISGSLVIAPNGSEAMRIDSDGRVGVGVTPKSWVTSVDVIDVGTSAAAYYSGGITHNAYFDNTNIRWEYKGTGPATFYNIQGGEHVWSYAASGTADNPITFNEAMRITSSGNLLVGTTDDTPSANNDSGGASLRGSGQLNVSRDGAAALDLNRKTSDGDIAVFRKDGTTVGLIGSDSGYITIGKGDTGLLFQDGGDAIQPRDVTGLANRDAAIDLGVSGGRFKNLYLSGGVYLGGTAAANQLDDYETGTWTPVVADASSGGNTATGTFTGSYVKVGKLVTIQCVLADIDTTGMTAGNILYIQGLPFSASSSNSSYGQLALQNTSFTGQVTVFVGDSRSYAYLREFSSGGTLGSLTVSDYTSGSADVYFVLQYEAA